MADITLPTADPALDIIDEQVAILNVEIQTNIRRLELDTAVRDRLLAVRATLARKVRPRKPRVATDAAPSTTEDASPRPSVFAIPSMLEVRPANDEAPPEPAEAAPIKAFMVG